MSSRDQLDSYIAQLEGRLRLGALLRGAAILTSVALAATVVLVLIANHFAFSSWTASPARASSCSCRRWLSLSVLAWPFPCTDWIAGARPAKLRSAFPNSSSAWSHSPSAIAKTAIPFSNCWRPTRWRSRAKLEPEALVPDTTSIGALGRRRGLARNSDLDDRCRPGLSRPWRFAALAWRRAQRRAALRSASRAGQRHRAPQRRSNGNRATPRHAARSRSTSTRATRAPPNGIRSSCSRSPARSGYQFLFAGLPEGVEYYVEAGPLQSRHFNIQVVDLPSVKQIRVTYRFPSWTGIAESVEERGGDLRAVEGTQAELEITTDRPLKDGVLVFDDDQQLQLTGGAGQRLQGHRAH